MEFQADPAYIAQLEANRSGQFTPRQRLTVSIAALVTSLGLIVMCAILTAIAAAAAQGLAFTGIVGALFFIFFLLTYLYMVVTFYVNARAFVPDALSRNPVRVAQGELRTQKAQRDRDELPFSFIVGDYSFAPFIVPFEIKMEKGRRYRVYYAAHSRMFLGIEPED